MIGSRRLASVYIARIRCDNTILNSHLFKRGVSESPMCFCGSSDETSYHYLIECCKYDILRGDQNIT